MDHIIIGRKHYMLYLQLRNRFYFIGIEDDFPRYILAQGVFVDAKMENIIQVLQAAVAAYGLPKEILTDCGTQLKVCFKKYLTIINVTHVKSKRYPN